MKKGIIIAGIASIVFFTSIIAAVLSSTNSIGDSDADSHSNNSSSSSSSSEQLSTASASNAVSVDVVMPTKSSRPGCEENDACYIPSTITISRGESVTWKNT
ncbi:MAG: hypothetical protein GWN01_04085, partial [Nitrosopumilaceae archaeon]|nr:hypothetical protein [Nitrosopumilaceae archaeon]NIU86520.1 hypothetical protein [Nitrosopumilaceae archaeon]NIV66839.1 hypothetical protein [Nitrosopumilaceae archaeon]NIX60735.1 hypothetical protein [Nitrosopumilaceae archaeon]